MIIAVACATIANAYTDSPTAVTTQDQEKDGSSGSAPVSESWDAYWKGTASAAAYSAGGVNHPSILAFWDEYFRLSLADSTSYICLDIASGSGAVVERMRASPGASKCAISCLDVSAGAVQTLSARFPDVMGVVADAAKIPLKTASFDIVTSQFGIEYAHLDAFKEAARVVAPGGRIGFMMHHKEGGIYRECSASLDAIQRLRKAQFIPGAIRMFEAGFAAVRGADRAAYDRAASHLNPAVRAVEAILNDHGRHVAGDTVMHLYNDVAKIHSRIQHYEPLEVLSWLKKMDSELETFAGRMSSMRDAAYDEATFVRLTDDFRSQGFAIDRANPLAASPGTLPLAWVLTARSAA